MKISQLGGKKGATPPYSDLSKEKRNKQNDETFQSNKNRKSFKDSQDLMGGPQYHSIEGLSKEDRAAYAKGKLKGLIEDGKLWSEGRYHQ